VTDAHRAAEGIERINATATVMRLLPPEQPLSLLAMASNTVLTHLEQQQ